MVVWMVGTFDTESSGMTSTAMAELVVQTEVVEGVFELGVEDGHPVQSQAICPF